MISLLQLLLRSPQRKSPPVGARFESLESRCLLSLAPASDLWVTPAPQRPAEIAELPAGIVGGAAGMDSDVWKDGQSDSRQWVSLPPPKEYPAPPPPDPLGDWSPPGDVWTPNRPVENPPDLPDWSDQGGPVDLDSWTHPDKANETKYSDDSKEVQSVLAALSFVPAPRTDLAADPLVALETPQAAPATAQAAEGGTVVVARGPLVEPETYSAHDVRHEAWLEAPVQVESMNSRFQAFEISTAAQRAAPAAANASAECDDSLNPSSQTPAQSLPTLDDVIWGELPAEIVPPAGPPAADAAETEEEVPLAAPPADDRIGLSLNAAAIAILIARLIPVTRPATSEESSRHGALTERRPRLNGLPT